MLTVLTVASNSLRQTKAWWQTVAVLTVGELRGDGVEASVAHCPRHGQHADEEDEREQQEVDDDALELVASQRLLQPALGIHDVHHHHPPVHLPVEVRYERRAPFPRALLTLDRLLNLVLIQIHHAVEPRLIDLALVVDVVPAAESSLPAPSLAAWPLDLADHLVNLLVCERLAQVRHDVPQLRR